MSSSLRTRTEPTTIPPVRAAARQGLPIGMSFSLLILLSFFINVTAWAQVTNFLGPELGAVSKMYDEQWRTAIMLLYRVGFLGAVWRAEYDYIDVCSLATLTTLPYAYILHTYYAITTYTTVALIVIEIVSVGLPIYFLRTPSPVHRPSTPLKNRFLLESFQVQLSAAMLAIGVYIFVLWSSLKFSFLNEWMITHFDIPTLEDAHKESPITLLVKVFIAGFAVREFLVNPSIASSGTATPVQPFDPKSADLQTTLKHNFWWFKRRTRVLVKQTAVLNAFLFANTAMRSYNLRGADLVGALGYAVTWVLANWLIAGWWIWIGEAEEEVEA